MKKIPVNIISGFLGSGKTTAIIRLFEQKSPDENWAIVVNEFGQVAIDGQTLRLKSSSNSVYDIIGGCICCSAKASLHETLEKTILPGNFDRILIEPSGLGGIEMVSDIIAKINEMELMPIICLVDLTVLDNIRIQRNLIYQSQIRMSDRIVFSKVDLLKDLAQQDELIRKFENIFPNKKIYSVNAYLTPDILETHAEKKSDIQKYGGLYISNKQLIDKNYRQFVFSFEVDQLFEPKVLEQVLLKYPDIIRAKGHINTRDGWKLFDLTLSGIQFETTSIKERNELVIITEKTGINSLELEKILLGKSAE
jgi:G3E family GTPase